MSLFTFANLIDSLFPSPYFSHLLSFYLCQGLSLLTDYLQATLPRLPTKEILFISSQIIFTYHHQAIHQAFTTPTFTFCSQLSTLLNIFTNSYAQSFANPQSPRIMLKPFLILNLYLAFSMSSQS